MTDPDLNNKLDRLLTLLEAQLELTRQGHQEERLQRAQLSREETMDLSHSEDQAGGGDESMIGDPHTPTPAPRPRRSVSFNLDEQEDINYEKYASPTGPRYDDQSHGCSTGRDSKRVVDLKLRIDRAREGRLFNDWHYFTERLSEQFNPRNARMEAYNKLLALRLTSDTPGAATRHVERFRDLEGQVNLDDNELVIDLFRGSLTRSIQEKFERNPPGKRWEWYRENWVSAKSKFDPHPTTHSNLSSSITITSNYTSNYTKPKPTPSSSSHPTLEARKPCSIRLWSPQQTPSRRPPTQEMATQAALRRVTPRPWTSAHTSNPWTPITRREHNDDDDEGKLSDSFISIYWYTQSGSARAGDLTMRRPTLHGNEFVSAERILRAALEDGPIGFMLLEEPPSSLPAFGFVPTGADKGVEMEVEVDKVVTAADIPKPYQHLRDVFDEVEADKLPHHTEHDLHLDLARSPVLFVPKKDGGLRLCVDYRGLNEITVKNRAPLPLIEEQLFLLRKARIYTKLDLRAAYNLIRIAKGDEWKTAFGTQLGLYEYLVMPFGLANAPAHFQSFINDIFRDIIGIYVVVYLDDFLIFSDTEEAHVKHVTEVLTRLRSNRLFAKLSKCEFHTKTVEFLGYIIKPTGIEMDPEKVRTVKEWPMLESIHDIQRFLGFANFYRRFIAHFARIAKPLTALVKPIERFKKFELPEEAQQAFHKLIQAFTSAGVLQHFDYHLPTRLETDAMAFYSRKMSSAEKNYEIHDKELLAVVACLTQWRHMLAGLPNQLVILTDHEALKYFKSQRRITGDKGGEPDALTRRTDMQPAGEEQDHNVRQLLPPRVFKETADHDSLLVAPMISMESIASKGLKDLVKIFQPLDQELQEIHRKKPFELKDDLWYSGGSAKEPLATPDRPWGSISLDFIEGLPPSKKYDSKTYDSILVIVDRLTKFAILAPTHKTVTAKQTAVLLYGHMVRLFRYPDHMVSDRGRQFISGAWKAFAEQMGVKHSLSTAYHPQTDGQTERVNQVIEQYLRMYCNYEQNDWANLLDTAAFVYNNTVHNSIGVSPFFACYGWNPKAHPDIPQRLGVNDPGRFEYLMDGKERCKYLQEQIREAQRRSVNQYNRKHKDIEFKVGDMVYINRRNWKTRRPTPKLDTRFAGPYPVQERPTIPSLPDEDLDFEVEALIDKRSHNGTTEYKVLWRGYSEEAASWEPVENLNCPDLIQEYEVSEGGRNRRSRERKRKEDDVERRRKDDVGDVVKEEESA
ncbi:hypothetical protein NDA10_008131 [Ustilago hordei]|nr:hypothetical protein NDA10_008131 [Ustilago hordei]